PTEAFFMPATPATRSMFRDLALLSGLVTPEQLDQAFLTAGVAAEGPPAPKAEVDDALVAKRLVEMGVLTSFQAERILQGRTKFTLGPYTITHGHIKPGNILVTSDGIAKVSDLGLAGFLHDAENDPRSGKIVGTADYLAPEQIRTPGEVTHLIDIYSLGCTLYYAVCGKVPFPGGTAAEKARR